MNTLHDHRLPGESDEYRKARDALLEAEAALREQVEQLAALRRQLPPGGLVPEDYVFEQVLPGPATVRLSELFEDGKDSLVLYSFMFAPEAARPCPACTSIGDIYNSYAAYIEERVNFAVAARSGPDQLKALAEARDWTGFRFLSSANNSYNQDYHAEAPGNPADQFPMLNVFRRVNGEIRHFWASELFWVGWEGSPHPRHVDMIWPIWNLLDYTPEGRGSDWFPNVLGA